MESGDRKGALREQTACTRAALDDLRWAVEDDARTIALVETLDSWARSPAVVAAYASRPGEPGTSALLDALTARGWRILLPILRRLPDWAWFTGHADLIPGWAGIPQPTGPRLGAEALGWASLIIVPCLAAGRDGTRLGTGGGWYDRALPHRHPGAPVIALARDAEVYDSLPTQPHDIMIDGHVTESGLSGWPPGWESGGPPPIIAGLS